MKRSLLWLARDRDAGDNSLYVFFYDRPQWRRLSRKEADAGRNTRNLGYWVGNEAFSLHAYAVQNLWSDFSLAPGSGPRRISIEWKDAPVHRNKSKSIDKLSNRK